MSRVRVAILLAVLTLAAACGDDGAPTAASSASSASTTSTSTSTTSTTTTTTTAPTTSSNANGCAPFAGVPAAATSVVDRSADSDGDGAPDTIHSYRLGDTWHLVAELSGGGASDDVAVPATEVDPGGLRVIGGTNLTGGDNRAEIFAVQGAGASTEIVVLYELEGCILTRVLAPNGSAWGFPVGGGVLHRGMLSCGAFEEEPVNWLFEQAAERTAEDHWDVHTIGYALTGASPAALQVTVEQDDVFTDEQLSSRPDFKCGDLSLD